MKENRRQLAREPCRVAFLLVNRRVGNAEIAEHLVNKIPQMRAFRATEGFVMLTKQTKIDQCERVRMK